MRISPLWKEGLVERLKNVNGIIQGVPPILSISAQTWSEQWAEYSHKEETRGSQTAETKILEHESGES
jgi:hypothetical protein